MSFHQWACIWTLSSQKWECKSFFTMEEGQNAQSKKDLVSQGSVSGIMPAYCTLKWKWTFIEWLTSWTMSSLGHNEEIVGGTDMVWKLCDKEECPKFKLLVKLLFVLCKNGLICWKTTKNFGWVSIRVSTTALYWIVLDELKWLWLLAEVPGAHWRRFQAVIADFSDRNVPLECKIKCSIT